MNYDATTGLVRSSAKGIDINSLCSGLWVYARKTFARFRSTGPNFAI
jgi:hypothetical protein